MRVYFNGDTVNYYTPNEGSVFTFCKNETLDSGKIRISNVQESKRLSLQPYDLVKITEDNRITGSDIYMLVDTVSERMTCLSPKIYEYEIDLFSETKTLENIILPNLKITKVAGQTRSVYSYLQKYVSMYGEKIRVSSGLNNLKYVLKNGISTKFSMECPEMQWNQPTLREVLTDLMMVADCIPIIRHRTTGVVPQTKVIDYLDLTEVGDDITENTNINYVQSSKSSENYVSELYIDLKNVTSPQQDNIISHTIRNKYYPFTAESSLITTDNLIVKTQYPIYKIKSLKVAMPYMCMIDGDLESHRVWIEYDLCHLGVDATGDYINFVYEEKEWQLLDENYSSFISEPFIDWPLYRSSTLYYTRNSDIISGFSGTANKWIFDFTFWEKLSQALFDNCRNMALAGTPLDGHTLTFFGFNYPDFKNSFFTIEYETLEGSVFTASKGDYPRNKRIVIDNQTNSYVDSYNSGFLEYQKANRLGNEQLLINARYENHSIETNTSAFLYSITVLGGVTGTFNFTSTSDSFTVLPTQSSLVLKLHLVDGEKEGYMDAKGIVESISLSSGYITGSGKILVILNLSDGWTTDTVITIESCSLVAMFPLIKISDYYDGNIIYQTEYQVFTNHIEVNALATKNYILRNYFTGVKSKIRSWAIAEAGEALTRHDLSKYYMEFSYKRHEELSVSLPTAFNWSYFADVFQDIDTPEPLKAGCFSVIGVDNDKYPTTSGDVYAIDLVSRIIGDSLVFTFGSRDNVIVDKYVTQPKDIEDDSNPPKVLYSGLGTNNYRYADVNGEFQTITYRLVSELDPTFATGTADENGDINKLRKRPEIVESSDILDSETYYKNTLTIWKDSQEITYVSTQIEYCSDTTDIFFTRKFLEYQKAVYNTTRSTLFYLKTSSSYDFREKTIPADAENCGPLYYSSIPASNQIDLQFGNQPFSSSIEATNFFNSLESAVYVTDADGNLLLAMNNIQIPNQVVTYRGGYYYPTIRLYLNVLKDRNKGLWSSRLNDKENSEI